MTHHWQDTDTGAELVVDGVVRADIWCGAVTDRSGERLLYDWCLADPYDDAGEEATLAAAKRAAERALGLPPAVNDYDPELPRWHAPGDSEAST